MQPGHEQVQAVKDRLRAAIFRGELVEGTALLEENIRGETGASVRAVRQALTDLAREGLIDRRRHAGTFVSKRVAGAQEPALPKVMRVAVVSGLLERDFAMGRYNTKVMNGIQSALHPPGKIRMCMNVGNVSTSPGEAPPVDVEVLLQEVQGVISVEANHAPFLDDLVRAGLRVVSVDYHASRQAFDSVVVDHQEAGRLATEHLLALGHRRIAFIGEGPNPRSSDPTWQDRLTGYLRAMAGAGGESPTSWILNIRRESNRVTRQLPDFHQRHQPSAYVASGGGVAERAIEALAKLGCRCPQQVSVASCDAESQRVAGRMLSHVQVEYEELGKTAVKLVAARLCCRQMSPVCVTLPVDFRPGDTSGPVA